MNSTISNNLPFSRYCSLDNTDRKYGKIVIQKKKPHRMRTLIDGVLGICCVFLPLPYLLSFLSLWDYAVWIIEVKMLTDQHGQSSPNALRVILTGEWGYWVFTQVLGDFVGDLWYAFGETFAFIQWSTLAYHNNDKIVQLKKFVCIVMGCALMECCSLLYVIYKVSV